MANVGYKVNSSNQNGKRNATPNDSSQNAKKQRNDDSVLPKQENDVDGGKDVFSLLVSNIPYQWTCEQIADYINENCIDVYTLEQIDGGDLETGQRIQLTFTNFEQCNKARKQLKLKAIDGKKLDVVYKIPGESDSDGEMDIPLSQRRAIRPLLVTSWENSIDVWATEPTGTYGLKPSYLESLGITVPIDKWIHVSNFRCDKSELKEVLELAGQVVICRVVCAINKYATVMYSHPLEAVQAVAMLNGQTFYGQVLKVCMYRCDENDLLLPKGLAKVGPGLGIDGKPLRDIVQQYERYLNGKTNCVNDTLFDLSNNEAGFNADTEQECNDANIQEEIDINENLQSNDITNNDNQSNNESNEINDPGTSGNTTPKENVSTTITQNLRRTDNTPIGPDSVPRHPNGTPNMTVTQFSQHPISQMGNQSFRPETNQTGYIPGPVYGPQNMASPRLPQISARDPRRPFPGPYQGPRIQGPPRTNSMGRTLNTQPNRNVCLPQKTSPVVELSNLPLSTTFPILSEKLAQVGQVISLELTRVGCAIVRFATPAHAEACYLRYNKLFVMGNTIEVKFL